MSENSLLPPNFVKNIIDEDLAQGKMSYIVTRFPPEPNGFLHIGHAAAAYLNFSLAKEYPGSRCHLRFDDTNPEKEDMIYVEAIQKDLKWLGFEWNQHLYFASDYFDKLYDIAIDLIKAGKAYVCELSAEEMIQYRGTLTQPGRPSPFRDRGVEENLTLFRKMRDGQVERGAMVLRAKIDMNSGNVHMRDPVLYRIRKVPHPKVGNKWPMYPSYDYSHCLSDAFEGITHSLCSIEFQDHRPLYDWIVAEAKMKHVPHQYEFTRLNLNYTVTSKRKLKQLVDEGHVSGWDDPRMPTLAGMRARGYPPEAIHQFCYMVGVSRRESVIDMSLLEDCVRSRLNETSPRAMAVLEPLKVTLTNLPNSVKLAIDRHPQKPEFGTRDVLFSKVIYVEKSDFQEVPENQFFRLAPGKEVRLRGSYVIRCDKVIKNQAGEVVELECSVDLETLGQNPVGRKVKGVIHWVSADGGFAANIVEYDRLFSVEDPSNEEGSEGGFLDFINPKSMLVHEGCMVEKSLEGADEGQTIQFERLGYFSAKRNGDSLTFVKTVSLKDSWAKAKAKG